MARATTTLTDTKIKSSKAKDKDYKLSDNRGLFLLVTKTGGKHWKLKYLFDDKEQKLSLGKYPDITLIQARALREKYNSDIANGINPSEVKKENKKLKQQEEIKQENTLNKISDEFFIQIENSVTEKYLTKLKSYYTNHIKATLGTKPIKEIQRADIIKIVDEMQNKGIIESAKKTLNLIERIYKFSVAREYTEHNIIADFDKSIVLKKSIVKHHATITDDKTIKILLDAINNYSGETVTRYALKIIPYLALRPIELRSLEWSYINLKDNLIVIPANKMKMRLEHIIPITSTVKQMIEELREHTADNKYLFKNAVYKDRYMSENTINTALRRMGFSKDEIVSHGFRSMFSTITHEKSTFKHEVIETQLAHSVGSSVSQAYNRAKYLDERVELMQWWSDYLDDLMSDEVVR